MHDLSHWDYLEAIKLNYEDSAIQDTYRYMSMQYDDPLRTLVPLDLCQIDDATAVVRSEVIEWCEDHISAKIHQETIEREYNASEIWGVNLHYTFVLPVIQFKSEGDRIAFRLRWV